MFVVLEGLHGVGKSEVAESLANVLGAELVPTVNPVFRRVRSVVDRGTSLEWRHAMYAVAVLDAGSRIREHLESGQAVVAESWLYRTVAFHRGMGSKLDLSFEGSELPLPDWTFVLTCDEEERQKRLKKRGVSQNRWQCLAECKRRDIEQQYRCWDMERVDTTNLQVDEVVRELRERIDRLRQSLVGD